MNQLVDIAQAFRIPAIQKVAILIVLLATSANGGETRPNILFAISDDQSFPHASAYGCQWIKTPGFDRVADAGVLFTKAFAPTPGCSPTRACILTGRNTWQLEEACNHWPYFPVRFRSFVEVLGNHGYDTGCTGKGWAPGIAREEDGTTRQLTGRRFNTH